LVKSCRRVDATAASKSSGSSSLIVAHCSTIKMRGPIVVEGVGPTATKGDAA